MTIRRRSMTAKELIAELEKLPPDTRIFVHGYEWGYHFANSVEVSRIEEFVLDCHGTSFGGPHDKLEGVWSPDRKGREVVKGITL